MARGFDALPPGPVGGAVSGGSDSYALLLLAAAWAETAGRRLTVATVDHNLRPESRAEADAVAAFAAAKNLSHRTLTWEEPPAGNLQDAARRARYRLLGDWARDGGLGAVLLGHTLDDQAETVLQRLVRGSGVDGLSAMAPLHRREGVLWARPLLCLRRADLRAMLSRMAVTWQEDPSNDDTRFQRVQLRHAGENLDAIGLTAERLAATADRMALARDALEHLAAETAARAVTADALGYLRIDTGTLRLAPLETQLRLLAAGLIWVTGVAYRPRLSTLKPALAAALSPGFRATTLHGAILADDKGALLVTREPGRTMGPVRAGALWDQRWTTPPRPGAHLRAMTKRELAEAGWKASGHPYLACRSVPGLFENQALLAAPFANPLKGCHFMLARPPEAFFNSLTTR